MDINWTARRARAVAFIGQTLKPGRAWSSLTYEYQEDEYEMAAHDETGSGDTDDPTLLLVERDSAPGEKRAARVRRASGR
jgi:hypothetical protein